MKVVLMQDIPKLGRKYDLKEVAAGFARNFLLPRGQAIIPGTISEEKLKTLREKHANTLTQKKEELKTAIAALAEKKVIINVRANEEGHLFAGVGKDDIAAALKDQRNLTVDTEMIHLGKALKTTGSHEVEIGEGDKIEVIIAPEA